MTRLDSLTGLRGLAALLVLGFHGWALGGGPAPGVEAPWWWVLRPGWLGVDVFFVLSGFLLMRGLRDVELAGRAIDWPAFFLRRGLRLLPAFHFQLAVFAMLGMAGVGGALAWTPSVGEALAHAVLWINAWPWVGAFLGPWWSLSVELGFYLTLPLLLPLMRTPRRAAAVLFASVVLCVAWRASVVAVAPDIEQRLGWSEHVPGRWVQFVAGAWLAAQPGDVFRGWRYPSLVAALACLILLALPGLVPGVPYNSLVDARPWTWGWPAITALPVLALIASLVAVPDGWLARALAAAPLRAVGVISYSLYLWHYPVQWWLRGALGGFVPPEFGTGAFVLASLVLAALIASVSWRLVEQPAMAWARRRARLAAP